MRANRRNNAHRTEWYGRLCPYHVLALFAVLAVSAHAADGDKKNGGAAPPPPEVAWDVIESWAGGNAIPDSPKVAEPKRPRSQPTEQKPATPPVPPPPAEVKPAWTPAHPGEHRPEPPQIAEHRQTFLRRGEYSADRAEKSRDLERAFQMYYRAEHYPQALQELVAMKQDPRHFGDKDTWLLEKAIETLLVMPQPPLSHGDIEARFADWKKKRLELMKEESTKPDFNKDWWNWDLAQREAMLSEKPSLMENLLKREQQGEADPAILWEISNRYNSQHPPEPLRLMSTLYKMREWYPEHEAVKKGEVQWRIVNVLSNDLELHKEAADEAAIMQERFAGHSGVVSGDNLWTEAENRRMYADENHPKREQIELWREAKHLYEEFRQAYPAHPRNHPSTPQDKKSDCQFHIDELRDRLH